MNVMKINVDLHSHSEYSPSVFNVSLEKIAYVAHLKGIDIIGTGDCLFPTWRKFLAENLKETKEGLFQLKHRGQNTTQRVHFVLQTELIFTFAKKGERGRKRMDVVVLFPSFDAVDAGIKLLNRWGVKNTTGRPFILCETAREVGDKIGMLSEIDPWVEVIPAHIMTPEGIFGSRNNISSFKEVFGEIPKNIYAVETGLSANVEILSLIPELDNFTFISSSDLHSSGFQMVGRESTVLEIEQFTYKEMISAIRNNKVAYTIEFPPSEGKYFFSGHRGDRPGHNGRACYYSPVFTPSSKICPICRRKLSIGVLERAMELRRMQGGKRSLGELKPTARPFIQVVPLYEILNNVGGNEKDYLRICKEFGNELKLWETEAKEAENKLFQIGLDFEIVKAIVQVKNGNYCFKPPGYDGNFGKLRLGEYLDVMQMKEGPLEGQLDLF